MSVPGKSYCPSVASERASHTQVWLVAFNDIGKAAKDLLSKDYPIGGVKLEVKTTAPNGVVRQAPLSLLATLETNHHCSPVF